MNLEVLIDRFNREHQRWGEIHKRAETKRENVNNIVMNIRGYVKKDFEKFLNHLNQELQNEQKITKWIIEDEPRGYIYYNGTTDKNLRVYIEIKEIGLKPCIGVCDEPSLPVPDYLKDKLKKFTDKYSFPINIWLDNANWESECK
jgi:hypothetical protein